MRFFIEVGEIARERVEFSFNQLLGRTVIRSNGVELKRSTRWFSEPVVDTHVLDFAEKEKVQVRIEKKRRLLFGSRYSVFVNDQLVDCFQGV